MVPYKPKEHIMPIWMNTGYRKRLRFRFQNSGREDVMDFKARLGEREMWKDTRQELIQMRMVIL